jgi:hypothetical protein
MFWGSVRIGFEENQQLSQFWGQKQGLKMPTTVEAE